MLMTSYKFIYDWQTLIAGVFALVGAIVTVRALRKQAREEVERRARAVRVMLPAALDALIAYSIESLRWLESIREKATLSEKGTHRGSVPVNTPPKVDQWTLIAFRDCVESVDIDHVRFISGMVSKIQIQAARMASLNDYLTNYQLYQSKRFGLSAEIDDAGVVAIRLVARANQLFPYARLETDVLPPPLDLTAVRNAF